MRKTQKLVNKLLVELERTGIPLNASNKIGIARSTYYRWRQEDLDFKTRSDEAILIGRENVIDLAESKLIRNINDGNERSIEYYLRHNDPRYRSFNQREFAQLLQEQSQKSDHNVLMVQALVDVLFDMVGIDGIRKLAHGDDSKKDDRVSALDQEKIESEARKLAASWFMRDLTKSEVARRSKIDTTPNNTDENTLQ